MGLGPIDYTGNMFEVGWAKIRLLQSMSSLWSGYALAWLDPAPCKAILKHSFWMKESLSALYAMYIIKEDFSSWWWWWWLCIGAGNFWKPCRVFTHVLLRNLFDMPGGPGLLKQEFITVQRCPTYSSFLVILPPLNPNVHHILKNSQVGSSMKKWSNVDPSQELHMGGGPTFSLSFSLKILTIVNLEEEPKG